MANNLHISYDLYAPGQNYDRVIEAIRKLGGWAKIHKSYWYVDSHYSASEAHKLVKAAMDANDSLYVVDATNNDAAWHNISREASEFIKDRWYAKAA